MSQRSFGTKATVLAFLMVFTVMASVPPPQAAAQQTPIVLQSEGCLEVATYPDFGFQALGPRASPEIFSLSSKAREYTQRTVRVGNNCDADIDEIRFLYYIRQGRVLTDVHPKAGDTLLTSPSNSFRIWDEGEPVFGICYPGQEESCSFELGTTIESVSADGRTATLTKAPLNCMAASPGPAPCPHVINDVSDGIIIGCSRDPRDPCTDEASITWDADRSFARGWTVYADNRARDSLPTQMDATGKVQNPFIRELVFKAETTQPVRAATASCGDRTIIDAALSGSTLTSATANFQNQVDTNNKGDIGKPVVGAGIPDGTTIVSWTDTQTVTLSNPVTTGTGVTVTIGTPPPCSTNLLRDVHTNFLDVGVVSGMVLNVLAPHPASGRYTVSTVTSNEVSFFPAAPASLNSLAAYSIVAASGRNATLLPGSMGLANEVSRAQDFTIAFTVRGSEGLGIPLQVVGYKAAYAGPQPLPYETTCKAENKFLKIPGHSLVRCLLPSDHRDVCNPPLGECLQSPGLYVAIEGTSDRPDVESLVTRDMDSNGHIDRIVVTFNKRLDPRTFDPFLFSFYNRLAGYAPKDSKGYTQYVITNGFLTEGFNSAGRTATIATFLLQEQPYYDTGGPDPKFFPYINYAAPRTNCLVQEPCGVRDLAGTPLRGLSGTSKVAYDGAPPVMVGSWARSGHDRLDVFFSEPVGTLPYRGTALCYVDQNLTPPPPNNTPRCKNNKLEDLATDFLRLGVEAGDFLLIRTGAAAGFYEITDVRQNNLTFTLPASGPVLTGDEYEVYYCFGICNDDLVLFDGGGSSVGATPCNAISGMANFGLDAEMVNDKTVTKNVPAMGWHYQFLTRPNPSGSGTIKMGDCDVHPLTGDALGPLLEFTLPGQKVPRVFRPYLENLTGTDVCVGPALCYLPRIHDFASLSCEPPLACPELPLVYLDLPSRSGVTGCSVPADCTTTMITRAGGQSFVTLNPDTNVQVGMQLEILSGVAMGKYNITAVTDTTITFDPPAAFPPLNNTPYRIQIRTHDNKTWPSGGVEVRPHGFARHATFPLVISADMDIQAGMPGVEKGVMRVKFNGPVAHAFGGTNKTTTAVTHAHMDIASATGTGQGPQGFVRILFAQPGVDTILLETDHPARPTDVDNSPSFYKVHCDRIQGLNLRGTGKVGTSSFVPCDDPDRYYGWDSDPAGAILKADVAIVDVTPPRIVQARTVDSNRDGYVDGIELSFSEPVNDSTFCDGHGLEPDYCQDSPQGGNDNVDGPWTLHNPWSPNSGQRETRAKPAWAPSARGGFRWDTGSTQNDNVGILQLVNTTLDPATGAYVVRTRNFEEDYSNIAELWKDGRSVFHRSNLASDYLPHLTLKVQGLFRDMAQQPVAEARMPPNYLPAYCQLLSPAQYPNAEIGPSTLNWNGPDHCTRVPNCAPLRTDVACGKDLYTVKMLDGAPPVVWRALTADLPFYDEEYCNGAKCRPALYGNGTIDGYRLIFSEPVKDSTYCRGDWNVAGYEPGSGIHDVLSGNGLDPRDPRRAVVQENDNQFLLRFNETVRLERFSMSGARTASYTAADLGPDGLPIPDILTPEGKRIPGVNYTATKIMGPDGRPIPVPNTHTRPELTYTPTCGLTDIAGNVMPAFNRFGVTEEDGAAPVIIAVEATPTADFLTVRFSEPVDDGGRGPLVRDDFNYYDVDRQGVTGKSSSVEVCHGDGDYVIAKAGCASHPLDVAIVPLGHDGAGLTAGDIAQDRVAAVHETIREVAPSVDPALRQAVPNIRMPLTVTHVCLKVDNPIVVKVEPELVDAGAVTLSWLVPNCPPVSYDVKVGNGTAITNVQSHQNPRGIITRFTPEMGGLVETNQTQTLLVSGLMPDTMYHFIVTPSHNNGLGTPSNQVSTRTHRDVTPPDCLDAAGRNVVACPMVISSDNCRNNQPTSTRTCTFKWTAAKDEQSPLSLRYHYKVSDEPLDRVIATDASTNTTGATVTFPRNGTQYFHVAAFSGGGFTQTAHFSVLIGAGSLTEEAMLEANDCIQSETRPVRVQVGEVYVNQVHWGIPDTCQMPGNVVGLEIWRKDGNSFVRVHRVDGSLGELRQGNWTDIGGNARSQYRVQVVFEGEPEQAQRDPSAGYRTLDDQTPQAIPWWGWILIGISLALIVAGIVIFFVLRAKQKEQQAGVAYAWESANPDNIGIDEATGLPVHEVRCPSCNNPFQAIGKLPLPITCPNCGTAGTLD